MAQVVDATDATFQKEVLESDLPVLVDFWSETCPPCRAIAPLMKQLAAEYAGKVKIVKANVSETRQIAGQYQIMSVPTIMAFKKGRIVGQAIGARPKSAFEEMIRDLLA